MEIKNQVLLILSTVMISLIISVFNTHMINASDTFEGKITNNINFTPETIYGIGVYDHNCISIGNGLTQCDAGIETSKGFINFNYKHNMNKIECIGKGDKLKIDIEEGGDVKVTRLK